MYLSHMSTPKDDCPVNANVRVSPLDDVADDGRSFSARRVGLRDLLRPLDQSSGVGASMYAQVSHLVCESMDRDQSRVSGVSQSDDVCLRTFFQSVGCASSPKCCSFEHTTDRDTQGGQWISQASPRRDCMRLLLDLPVEGDCRVFLLFGYSRERAFLCGSAVRCGVSHAARVCFVVGVRNQWRF